MAEKDEPETFLSCVHVGTFGVLSDRDPEFTESCAPEVDSDGDLLVSRRDQHLTIEHAMSTPLSDVGLQVWRGSLIMADYLLHNSCKFRDTTILELGGGLGLVSTVAAILPARTVICTDIGQNVLDLCRRNVDRNLKNQESDVDVGVVIIRELNWTCPFHSECSNYRWTEDDLKRLDSIDYILAADVIYDDDLTDSLLSCLLCLYSKVTARQPTILISLEKRHFMQCLSRPHILSDGTQVRLSAETVPIAQLPQYFQYERVDELELWKIHIISDPSPSI